MRYERDESAVREAREGVQDAEDQLAIDALEKEIKLLEKQKEAIEKTMESTSKYYEKLIKQQEEYWDTLIEGLEKQKTKWEELAEIETIANAYAAIEQVFGPLGYTVEDVLNGSEAAFEDFKNKYIDLLKEMNSGNKPFLDGVDYAANTYQKSINEISKSSTEMKDTLQKVSDATTPLSTAADNVKAVGSAAQEASSGVGALKTSSEGISENLNELQNVNLENISSAFDGLATTLDTIIGKITGADSIQSAIAAINDATLLTGLAQAFTTLGNAVGVAAAAIGGGGADAEETYGGAGQHGKNGMPSDISASSVSGGTGQGLVGAINSVKAAADGSIGTSLEDASGTTISDFNLLGQSVDAVTQKVGTEDSDDEELSLVGTITKMPELTETPINEVINQFNLLLQKLQEVLNKVNDIIDAVSKVHVPDIGSGEGSDTGQGYTGTAQPHSGLSKASGDWGVKRDQTALVGELGQELLLRNGTYRTLGDNGPEFVKLRKNDVILNHKQTKEILSKKNHVRGLSMANGTVLSPLSSSTLAMQSNVQKALANVVPSLSGIQKIVSQQTKELVASNKQSSTPNINITNPQFTVSGVSGEDVMRKIEGAFEGLMLNAYQKAMNQ